MSRLPRTSSKKIFSHQKNDNDIFGYKDKAKEYSDNIRRHSVGKTQNNQKRTTGTSKEAKNPCIKPPTNLRKEQPLKKTQQQLPPDADDEVLMKYAQENGLNKEQFQELVAKHYQSQDVKKEVKKENPRVAFKDIDPQVIQYGLEQGLNQGEIEDLFARMQIKDENEQIGQNVQKSEPVQQKYNPILQNENPIIPSQQRQAQQYKQRQQMSNIISHEPEQQQQNNQPRQSQNGKGGSRANNSCPFALLKENQLDEGAYSKKNSDKVGNQQQGSFDYSHKQDYLERIKKNRIGNNIFG